jgi:GAF domain-containing protein
VAQGLGPQAPAAAEVELRRLVSEQAALRRVATFVAGAPAPEEVFQVVTGEVGTLLGLRSALLLRYEAGETATIVGKFGGPVGDFPVGALLMLEAGAARTVLRTGRAARVDYRELRGGLAARMLAHGFIASVAAPIHVAGALWGVLVAGLRDGARQRLVSLAVRLRIARAGLQRAPAEAGRLLTAAEEELADALAELPLGLMTRGDA